MGKRTPDCHPEREYRSNGLCKDCYYRLRDASPARKEYKSQYYKRYRASGRAKEVPSYAKRHEYKQRTRSKPEFKVKQVKYNARPEVKIRRRELASNPKARLKKKQYRDENRKMYNESSKKYSRTAKGRARNRAKLASRRARLLRASPKWANISEINKIYDNCPEGYEVDHIVPIKGRNTQGEHVVCGLHVETNLQVLLKSENRKKSNRFEPEWSHNVK